MGSNLNQQSAWPPQKARYIPPKPSRWHENLSWTMLLFSPFVVLLGVFLAGVNRLPSNRARLAAFAVAGFVIGLVIGLIGEAGWSRSMASGVAFSTLAMMIYCAMWFRDRGRPDKEKGWLDGVAFGLICVFAAVVFSMILIIVNTK